MKKENPYGDYRLFDRMRISKVNRYLCLDYGKAADGDYVYELRPREA